MAKDQIPNSSPTILPPRLVRINESVNDDLECSLHFLPKPLMREFGHVFNDEHLKFGDASSSGDAATSDAESCTRLKLLAIPTNQRAREDLVAVGDHVEEEKDRLLNVVSCVSKASLESLCVVYSRIFHCSRHEIPILVNQNLVSQLWKICVRTN